MTRSPSRAAVLRARGDPIGTVIRGSCGTTTACPRARRKTRGQRLDAVCEDAHDATPRAFATAAPDVDQHTVAVHRGAEAPGGHVDVLERGIVGLAERRSRPD